jgi:hypothetical protein
MNVSRADAKAGCFFGNHLVAVAENADDCNPIIPTRNHVGEWINGTD